MTAEAIPLLTLTGPVAPKPTTAVMVDSFSTVKDVDTPPKLTVVVPLKFVPVIVIVAPGPASVGTNEEMVGGIKKAKPPKDADPAAVVTFTSPDAPEPTTAVSVVASSTVKDAAFVSPKLTAVVPVRLVPVIVMVAPVLACVGENEAIVGNFGFSVAGSSGLQP